MGVLTPGGTGWWRGSDSWASAKGGSGRASSMRRCSRRGGEERGAGMSAVEMAGGGGVLAHFYKVGEAADRVVMAVMVRFQGGGRLRKGRRRGGGASCGRGKEEEAE
jgi:hypothetical protein